MINETPDYRQEMLRLIEAYINDDLHVSQKDYFECIDYLLDVNHNKHYDFV